MITITNLAKAYNKKVVLNINDLNISQGEFFGLVGNNGAGKTTLLRLMLDLIKAERGVVVSDNHITEICRRIVLIEKGLIIRDLQNNGNVLAELENYFSVEKIY